MFTRENILLVYGAYLALLTLITFIVYGVDKYKAKNGGWRIPEKTLLILSIIGGALGGYSAMNTFRHKTTREHWYFSFLNVLGILIHGALLFCIAFVFKF